MGIMLGGVLLRKARRERRVMLPLIGLALLAIASAELATAQVHGVPPSVTSIQFHVPPFLPNIMPSVTSLGPSPFTNHAGPIPAPYGVPHSVYGHGIYGRARRNGYGYNGYGGGYVYPYYV